MKRIMRCCSCGFEEEVELPENTTIEQLITFGNEWRLKHQPSCNTDPIKDGKFPTTMIIQTEGKLDPSCPLLLPCNFCRAEILCQYKIDKSSEENQDLKRLSKYLNEIEKSNVAMDQKASKSLTKFVEDLELEDQEES